MGYLKALRDAQAGGGKAEEAAKKAAAAAAKAEKAAADKQAKDLAAQVAAEKKAEGAAAKAEAAAAAKAEKEAAAMAAAEKKAQAWSVFKSHSFTRSTFGLIRGVCYPGGYSGDGGRNLKNPLTKYPGVLTHPKNL